MGSQLEHIKRAILEEYDRSGHVNERDVLARHPEFAAELIDFLFWLDRSPRMSELPAEPWADDSRVAAKALEAASATANESCKEEVRIGNVLSKVRSHAATRPQSKASKAFKRAAVLAWVVDQLGKKRPRVTRLSTQKTLYFVENGVNLGLFDRFQVMPLGPYDSQCRYKDAEPIARKRGWMIEDDSTMAAGPNVQEAHNYARNYIPARDAVARLVDLLGALTDSELETWATVHWAADELLKRKDAATTQNIVRLLEDDITWRPKLLRSNFTEESIANALIHLTHVGFIPQEMSSV
jgi:hypothetical protein